MHVLVHVLVLVHVHVLESNKLSTRCGSSEPVSDYSVNLSAMCRPAPFSFYEYEHEYEYEDEDVHEYEYK